MIVLIATLATHAEGIGLKRVARKDVANASARLKWPWDRVQHNATSAVAVAAPSGGKDSLFAKLDVNRDGVIDRQEAESNVQTISELAANKGRRQHPDVPAQTPPRATTGAELGASKGDIQGTAFGTPEGLKPSRPYLGRKQLRTDRQPGQGAPVLPTTDPTAQEQTRTADIGNKEPRRILGVSKLWWVLVADVLALMAYISCIPCVLSIAKRKNRNLVSSSLRRLTGQPAADPPKEKETAAESTAAAAS